MVSRLDGSVLKLYNVLYEESNNMKKFFAVLVILQLSQIGCAQKVENKLDAKIQSENHMIIYRLEQFKNQDHFVGDGGLYTGVQDPKKRIDLNSKVADAAQSFIVLYQHKNNPTKDELLQTLANGIAQIDPNTLDTEDREQVATTFESFLDIIGLKSSEGILNTWMYGEEINMLIEHGEH